MYNLIDICYILFLKQYLIVYVYYYPYIGHFFIIPIVNIWLNKFYSLTNGNSTNNDISFDKTFAIEQHFCFSF